MSLLGTPLYAITDGILVTAKRANGNGWNRLEGSTVMLQAAHDAGPIKKGDFFYYVQRLETIAMRTDNDRQGH